MKWNKKTKISTKLIIVMLLVSLIPLAAVGTYSFLHAQEAAQVAEYKANQVYASHKKDEIEEWFDDLKALTVVAASTRSTYNSLVVLRDVGGDLNDSRWQERVQMMDTGFEEMFREFELSLLNITDSDGRIVYTSNPEILGSSLKQRDYFQKAMQGQVANSDYFYSDIIHKHCIAISAPIYAEGTHGEIIGMFSIVINEEDISKKVTQGMELLGKTANAYIVNRDGLLLSQPRFGDLQPHVDTIETQGVRELLSNIRSDNLDYWQQSEYQNYLGQAVLGSYGVMSLGDNPIGIIIEVNAEEAFASVNRVVKTSVIIFIAAFAFIVITATLFSKTFTRPIAKLLSVSEQAASGELDVVIDIDNNDEIGALAQAFQKMLSSLHEIVTNINAAAEQVAAGANQLSDSSVALSQGATEQASSIEQLTASLEQISAQATQNAANATEANRIATLAKEKALQGNAQMSQMLQAMAEINDSSSNISKIINVIEEIAFQTNILALNAAVEAARAGQHGRGFAVVAEEVRNLAARSADAAKETTALIKGSIKKVEEGAELADLAANALQEIVEGIEQAANLVGEIATASHEQAVGVAQINEGVTLISDVVQTNAATSEEAAAASEELASQAEFLNEQVSGFKIKRTAQNKVVWPERLSRQLAAADNDNSDAAKELNYYLDQTVRTEAEEQRISLSDVEFGKY